MDGGASESALQGPVEALAARLSGSAETRLAHALLSVVGQLHSLVADLKPSADELRHVIEFLTEVGHSADARRQEWVLLADVIGISTLVEDINSPRPNGATPNTLPGPFYRSDVPDLPNGANLSRDGKGPSLFVNGRITDLQGQPVPQAGVEVWHANAEGLYENQEPDLQPEFNLRGRLRADDQGNFHFLTVKPKGYHLPEDGPVGRLLNGLGLALHRPAHLHFRITAPGCQTLTTHVFDRADPAIHCDALFGVKPALLADFRPSGPSGGPDYRLDVTFVLAPQAAVSESSY